MQAFRPYAFFLLFCVINCYKASDGNDSPTTVKTSSPNPIIPSLAQPSISVVAGTYSQPQNITISASVPNATICYTISVAGTNPACDVNQNCVIGNRLTSGWSVQVGNGVLRTLACAPGYSSSPITTGSYVLDQTPPANVSAFTVTPGNTTIQLSWTNPGADFSGVTIVRKVGSAPTGISDGTQVYSGTGNSLTQTGMSNGTTYYYAAFSRDAVGNLSSGSFGSATPVNPPPGNATINTFNYGSATMNMSWSNPGDSDFAGVRVIRKFGITPPTGPSDGSVVYQGTGTTYSEGSLTLNQSYCYGIYAYDTAGGYASGVTSCATMYFYTPAIGVSAQGNQQLTLYFYASSTNDSTGVYIVRKTGSAPTSRYDGTVILSRSESPYALDYYTDTGLTNGVTYYYAIYAYNNYGTFSSGATTGGTPYIPNVTSFTVTPGYNQNLMTWTNPVAANFQQVKLLRKTTGYPADPSDGTLVYSGAGASATDASLPSGVLHYYRIFVYDTTGVYSSSSYQTGTPTPLSNATSLATVSDVNQISLSWQNPVQPSFAGVKVLRKTFGYPSSPSDGTVVYTGTGTTYVDTGLPSGTVQYYRVFSTDCCTGVSTGATISASPSALPEVTGFAAVPGARQITLNWVNPVFSGFVGVRLVRKAGGFPANSTDGTVLYNGSSGTYTDTNLANDETQYYRAFVYDGFAAFSSGLTLNSAADPGKEVLTGWNKQLGAPYYYTSDIKIDAAGNIYVAGYGSNLVNASSGSDWWIKKYDANGVEDTVNWDKKYSYFLSSSDVPNAMAIDSSGNVYVAGTVSTGAWWIKKFSASGVEDTTNWNKYIPNSISEPKSIAIDSTDQVYIAGYGEDLVGTNTNRDWMIRKYSPTGVEDLAWNKKIHSSGAFDDGATAIAIDSANNIYVAGYGYRLVDSSSMDDWWIKKFSSLGTEITSGWDKRYNSNTIYWDRPASIAIDSSNNVYVTGYWGDNSSGGTAQWMIKKFSSGGTEDTLAWNKLFPLSSAGADLAVDSSGNLFAAGSLSNKVNSSSYSDLAVKKFSSSGTEDLINWDRKFNQSNNSDYATGIAIDPSGFIYVAGVASASGAWIKKFNP